MAKYYTKNKATIEVNDTDFASGGEGKVFLTIKGRPDFCAKILYQNTRTTEKENKILYMTANPPAIISNEGYIICWPEEALYDVKGVFVGYTMKKAFSGSIQLYELTSLQIKTGTDWQAKYNRGNARGIQNRLKLCVNIAIAIHSVHQSKRYVLVDLKPQNVLVTKDGKVSVIDIDSIQIANNGKVYYHAKVVTPEYTPKESERLNPSKAYVPDTWDRFSMAVIFYEIIFGLHPYTATSKGQYAAITTINEKIRANLYVHGSKKNYLAVIPPPHTNYGIIPQPLKDLFLRSFETGSSNPNLRPSAEEWGKTMVEELKKKVNGFGSSGSVLTSQPQPSSVSSGSVPQSPEPNNSRGWIIFIIVILLGILGLILLLSNHPNENETAVEEVVEAVVEDIVFDSTGIEQ